MRAMEWQPRSTLTLSIPRIQRPLSFLFLYWLHPCHRGAAFGGQLAELRSWRKGDLATWQLLFPNVPRDRWHERAALECAVHVQSFAAVAVHFPENFSVWNMTERDGGVVQAAV